MDDCLLSWETEKCALFETRLLNAGQPLHPSAPPVPLHFPPPGQDPFDVWSAATYVAPAAVWELGCADDGAGEALPGSGVRCDEGGTIDGDRFRFDGLEAFRAFRYRPQALQIVAPCGDRLQRGVRLVPQLLSLISNIINE